MCAWWCMALEKGPLRKARVQICSLIVTRRCNFRCKYCYVTDYDGPDMTLDTAKRAVEEAFRRAEDYDVLEIDFLGGEPLCRFDLIRELSEWLWAREWKKPCVLFATTNGSLMDEEKKEWFSRCRDRFVLCLSFDGAKESQRENRNAAELDVDFFLRGWPEQTLQMTVSERSVRQLGENVIDIARKGGRCHVNCAYGMERWSEESFWEYERQLGLLAAYYARHPELEPVNVLAKPLPSIARTVGEMAAHRCGPMPPMCGMGRDYYVVDADGERYPCQLFSPLVLERTHLSQLRKWNLWERTDFTIPGCQGCPLTGCCPACYGTAFAHGGDPFRREYNHCRFFRSELKASCKYQAQRLMGKADYQPEDILTARAIRTLTGILRGLDAQGCGPAVDVEAK